MTIMRRAILGLVFGAFVVGGCSARAEGPGGAQTERSSANVITQAQIARLPSVSTVEDVLIQLVPGIDATGGGIQIRGMQGAPLIIVNGVPTGAGPIPVTPSDVARIEVLRTGGEIAAYGFRGNGGVILIQTR